MYALETLRTRKPLDACTPDYQKRMNRLIEKARQERLLLKKTDSAANVAKNTNVTTSSENLKSMSQNQTNVIHQFSTSDNDVDSTSEINDSGSHMSCTALELKNLRIFKSMLMSVFVKENMSHKQIRSVLQIIKTHRCFSNLDIDQIILKIAAYSQNKQPQACHSQSSTQKYLSTRCASTFTAKEETHNSKEEHNYTQKHANTQPTQRNRSTINAKQPLKNPPAQQIVLPALLKKSSNSQPSGLAKHLSNNGVQVHSVRPSQVVNQDLTSKNEMLSSRKLVGKEKENISINKRLEALENMTSLIDNKVTNIEQMTSSIYQILKKGFFNNQSSDAKTRPQFLPFQSCADLLAFDQASEKDYNDVVSYLRYLGGANFSDAAAIYFKASFNLNEDLFDHVTWHGCKTVNNILALKKTRFARACEDAMPINPRSLEKPKKTEFDLAMTKALKSAKEGFRRQRKRTFEKFPTEPDELVASKHQKTSDFEENPELDANSNNYEEDNYGEEYGDRCADSYEAAIIYEGSDENGCIYEDDREKVCYEDHQSQLPEENFEVDVYEENDTY